MADTGLSPISPDMTAQPTMQPQAPMPAPPNQMAMMLKALQAKQAQNAMQQQAQGQASGMGALAGMNAPPIASGMSPPPPTMPTDPNSMTGGMQNMPMPNGPTPPMQNMMNPMMQGSDPTVNALFSPIPGAGGGQ